MILASYYCIATAQTIQPVSKVFVTVDGVLTDFLKKEITAAYGSLKSYNHKHLHIQDKTFDWAFRKKNGHQLARFVRICDSLGLSEDDAYSKITGYYSWGSHNPAISLPSHILITPFFVEGYALYIAEGDTGDSGQKPARKLRFTNAEPSVINFFMRWLRMHFPEVSFYVCVILPAQSGFVDNTGQIDLSRSRMHFSSSRYNKQIKYRVCMDNCVVLDLLLLSRETIRKAVLLDRDLACAYLRGLMAGEGTVYDNRSRYVRLEMKNHDEIAYAKQLFELLGITYTFHKRTTRKGMESVYIGGRQNLIQYHELVGFGAQEKRQEKLEKLVECYKIADIRELLVIAQKEKELGVR